MLSEEGEVWGYRAVTNLGVSTSAAHTAENEEDISCLTHTLQYRSDTTISHSRNIFLITLMSQMSEKVLIFTSLTSPVPAIITLAVKRLHIWTVCSTLIKSRPQPTRQLRDIYFFPEKEQKDFSYSVSQNAEIPHNCPVPLISQRAGLSPVRFRHSPTKHLLKG